MRSYVLSGDTAHYDKVIEGFEALNVKIIPAFAGGLDGRPAIEKYFIGADGPLIDVLVSLTGFSLVGGPAYNDTNAAVKTLQTLMSVYLGASLEFQTLSQWEVSSTGLGPIETTMLVLFQNLMELLCRLCTLVGKEMLIRLKPCCHIMRGLMH